MGKVILLFLGVFLAVISILLMVRRAGKTERFAWVEWVPFAKRMGAITAIVGLSVVAVMVHRSYGAHIMFGLWGIVAIVATYRLSRAKDALKGWEFEDSTPASPRPAVVVGGCDLLNSEAWYAPMIAKAGFWGYVLGVFLIIPWAAWSSDLLSVVAFLAYSYWREIWDLLESRKKEAEKPA